MHVNGVSLRSSGGGNEDTPIGFPSSCLSLAFPDSPPSWLGRTVSNGSITRYLMTFCYWNHRQILSLTYITELLVAKTVPEPVVLTLLVFIQPVLCQMDQVPIENVTKRSPVKLECVMNQKLGR